MQTTLHIDGANCSVCLNEALDNLGRIYGVSAVHGSTGESCIEVDLEMFSNEIRSSISESTTRHPTHHPRGQI
ncbi:MAG: hypothetical protein ABI894_16305 [Ilumatobacteraceae bacterium]